MVMPSKRLFELQKKTEGKERMKRLHLLRKTLVAKLLLVVGIMFFGGYVFSTTVENPMSEDLDGGEYDIDNVVNFSADNIIAVETPWYDVRAYGAKGDGQTDDSTAIQAAITAAANNGGGTVYLPPGTYICAGQSQLCIQNSDIALVGAGWGRTTISYSHNLRFINVSGNISNITVARLKLTSSGSYVEAAAGRGAIHFDAGATSNVTDSVVSEVMIDTVGTTGISGGGQRNVIRDCIVRGTDEHGIYLANAQDYKVVNNYVYDVGNGSELEGGTCGIKIAGASSKGVIITGNHIEDFPDYGISFQDDASGMAANNHLKLDDTNSVGIQVRGNRTLVVANTIDVSSGGQNAVAIKVTDGNGAMISNNYIYGTPQTGPIQVRDDAENTIITGNVIEAGPSGGWTVYLYASTNPYLANNIILGGGDYGIHLGTASTPCLEDNQIASAYPYELYYQNQKANPDYLIRETNDYKTGGNGGLQIGSGTKITQHLSGTTTWDPAAINNTATTSTTVTVTGAEVGDTVAVGFSQPVPGGALLAGSVTATNTVTVTLFNGTGSSLDLASGTLRADVWKH